MVNFVKHLLMNTKKVQDDAQIFSFPNFEFGSPNSTLDQMSDKNSSPADHLFFNGRLLPHVFPIDHHRANFSSATRSRSSSVSSKDSWIYSSQNNSINSSTSSCSSARTSLSDNSERRLFYSNITYKAPIKIIGKTQQQRNKYYTNNNQQADKKVVLSSYGSSSSSKGWQFIIPAPTLNRDISRKRKVGYCAQAAGVVIGKDDGLKNKKEVKEKRKVKSGFGWRLFRTFLLACIECHAIAPSIREDVLQGRTNKMQ